MCITVGICVQVRTTLAGVDSILLLCDSQELNSGP